MSNELGGDSFALSQHHPRGSDLGFGEGLRGFRMFTWVMLFLSDVFVFFCNFWNFRWTLQFVALTFPFLFISPSSSRTNMSPWRHSSMARDFHDFDSMFSRSGATLPRGEYGSFFNWTVCHLFNLFFWQSIFFIMLLNEFYFSLNEMFYSFVKF